MKRIYATIKERKRAEYLRNREKYLARERAYRRANADKVRAYERKRYLEHPTRKTVTIARTARRRNENPECRRATDLVYRETHKEAIAAYNREYFRTHPEVQRQNNHRRRAQKQLAPFEFFKDVEIFQRDEWICQICFGDVDPTLRHPDPRSPSLDHIIPLARGGNHTRTNCQCAHLSCNKRKNCSVA